MHIHDQSQSYNVCMVPELTGTIIYYVQVHHCNPSLISMDHSRVDNLYVSKNKSSVKGPAPTLNTLPYGKGPRSKDVAPTDIIVLDHLCLGDDLGVPL